MSMILVKQPLVQSTSDDNCSTVSNKLEDKAEESSTIFLRRDSVDDDEMEDLWSLKRANAVNEDTDEEEEGEEVCDESPPKRQCTELCWDERVSNTDAPFQVTFLS